MTTFKALATTLFVTSLLAGCAATDPYTPESDKDFIYDNDMSFAMNVIDGSLGFHNGLRDANRPVDADTSPGAMDYLADGVIGFGGGGGFGGAFLSMLGTNQGNAPLNTYYGLVYYPVETKSKEKIQEVFDKIDQEIIDSALKNRDLTFVKTSILDSGLKAHTFSGNSCDVENALFDFEKSDSCRFIHYKPATLLKYSTTTPSGEKGLFAVIGIENFYTGTYLSLDLDEKYYVFSPVISKRTKFPFVSNANKVHLFIKPNNDQESYLTIEGLKSIDPWVNKHYQSNKNQ
ncbi:hypothetical protein ACRN9G_18965 [Shewanella frigidimarina]|uniref:hypothetical protein n=1 Tax=Shewanella frigidimarina TaxID=56812 RepID=UPI003D7B505E